MFPRRGWFHEVDDTGRILNHPTLLPAPVAPPSSTANARDLFARSSGNHSFSRPHVGARIPRAPTMPAKAGGGMPCLQLQKIAPYR